MKTSTKMWSWQEMISRRRLQVPCYDLHAVFRQARFNANKLVPLSGCHIVPFVTSVSISTAAMPEVLVTNEIPVCAATGADITLFKMPTVRHEIPGLWMKSLKGVRPFRPSKRKSNRCFARCRELALLSQHEHFSETLSSNPHTS